MENVSGLIGSILVAVFARIAGSLGIFPGFSVFVFWGAVVIGCLFLILTVFSLVEWINPRTSVNFVEQKILDVIVADIQVLARKKFQQTGANEYGVADHSRWHKEWDNYSRYTLPGKCRDAGVILPDETYQYLIGETPERKKKPIGRAVHEMIECAVAEMRDTTKDLQDVTPLGFEVLCLEKLKELGWDARTTKASGDQGADIIATHCDETLVVQCKLYGRPVGNKAVQEVAAARDHYRADYAAVVTNASFTRAAQDLAASTGVKLVSYVDMTRSLGPETVHQI